MFSQRNTATSSVATAVLLLIAVLLFAASAHALPIDGSAPTGDGAAKPAGADTRGFYGNARDMLATFGKRVKEASGTVSDSVVSGYKYSKERIGAVFGNSSAKKPAAASSGGGGETMQTAAATNLVSALIKPNSSRNDYADNSDQIVFRSDDDDIGWRLPVASTKTTTKTTTSSTTTSTTTSTTPTETPVTVTVEDRIILDVPTECPEGKKKAADGNCRKVV